MGGSVDPPPQGFPPWGYEQDFNLQADVSAAVRVLESCDPERTTLVPIEVTVQTALRRSDLPALRNGGPVARLLARQAEAYAEDERYDERYGREYEGLPSDLVNFQHDPLAIAAALGWGGVLTQAVPLDIAVGDGWLRLSRGGGGRPLRVVTGVDRRDFATLWLERVARL